MATSKRQRSGQFARWLVGQLAALACVVHAGAASAHDQGPCETSARLPALAEARAAIQRTPDALPPRLTLSDLLVESGCYEEAIHVLQEADAMHPKNAELQKRLRNARSFVSERQFFEGLDKAEAEAKLSRHVLRCTKFADVAACDDALVLKPDDLSLSLAKGDALTQAGRLTEAIAAYRRAATLAPGNIDVAAKLAAAEHEQQQLQDRCANGDGDAALAACQAVLVRNSPEEFDITKRIAVLQQSANQPSKALDAYIAANSLRRGDRSVALAIVALVDSTGRSDAVALAARGSSLVTLGRAREAVDAFKQAQALAPGLPGIANQLAAAERLVTQENRVRESQRASAPAAAAGSVAAPEATTTLASTAPARTYSNAAPASQSN